MWVQGEGVQRCVGEQRQAAKRNGQQPRPGGLWESKEVFQVVWKRLVMRVLTAASLSWTHQSTHTEENRRQQDTSKLHGSKGSRDPQATFVLYPRAARETGPPGPSQSGFGRPVFLTIYLVKANDNCFRHKQGWPCCRSPRHHAGQCPGRRPAAPCRAKAAGPLISPVLHAFVKAGCRLSSKFLASIFSREASQEGFHKTTGYQQITRAQSISMKD